MARASQISGFFRTMPAVLLLALTAAAPVPAKAWSLFPPKQPVPPAASAALAPHRAVYDIRMTARHNGSQILNISGEMFYSWKPSCESWLTDHRFKLRYEYADNPPMLIDSDFSTFEPFDGKSFDFVSKRRRNGELYEEARGHAKSGKAAFSVPAGLSFDLAPGTMFPMAHTLTLLDAIKKEKKFFTSSLFDGTDTDGPVQVSAFVGGSADPKTDTTEAVPDRIDASLLAAPARRVRFAFFPLHDEEAESDYEMTAVFHSNGVISGMQIDYDEFSVSQTLKALEKLPAEPCGAGGAQSPKTPKK